MNIFIKGMKTTLKETVSIKQSSSEIKKNSSFHPSNQHFCELRFYHEDFLDAYTVLLP